MQKKHYKYYYVIINLYTFDINITSNKSKASQLTQINRNTIAKTTDRLILNGFLIKLCKES